MILQVMTPFSTDYIKPSAIKAISTFKNNVGTKTLEINIQDHTVCYARVEDPVFFSPYVLLKPISEPEGKFMILETYLAIKKLMFGQGDNDLFLCSHADLVEVQSEILKQCAGT